MIVHAIQCDACCYQFGLPRTDPYGYTLPQSWYTVYPGYATQDKRESWHFCTLRCLSDWLHKTDSDSIRIECSMHNKSYKGVIHAERKKRGGVEDDNHDQYAAECASEKRSATI